MKKTNNWKSISGSGFVSRTLAVKCFPIFGSAGPNLEYWGQHPILTKRTHFTKKALKLSPPPIQTFLKGFTRK